MNNEEETEKSNRFWVLRGGAVRSVHTVGRTVGGKF
jgi:hypothetical protein